MVEELGRDHWFFLERDPEREGEWRMPVGVRGSGGGGDDLRGGGRVRSCIGQSDGRITCGRWVRAPVEAKLLGGGLRRAYPEAELRRLAEEFNRLDKPYVDPRDPAVARVPIMSWSRVRFEAVIDAADLSLIEGMRWNWMPHDYGDHGGTAAVVRSAPSGEQVPLTQVLLGSIGRGIAIGHLNADPLDCRRSNLVVKTHGEVVA